MPIDYDCFAILAGLIFNPEIRNEEGVDLLIENNFWNLINYSYSWFNGITIKRGSIVHPQKRSQNSEIPDRKTWETTKDK